MYLYNSIVMGYPDGINIDGSNVGSSTQQNVLPYNGSEQYHRYKTGCKEIITSSPSANASVIDLLQNHASNRYYTGNAGILLTAPYNMSKPTSGQLQVLLL